MLADKYRLYSTYGLVGPLILKTTMQRNAFLTALKFLINLKKEKSTGSHFEQEIKNSQNI